MTAQQNNPADVLQPPLISSFAVKTMIPDLKWMVGRSIIEIEKKDYTWFFHFDDATIVAAEDCWRLVTAERIAVPSKDHGHQFGLDSPVGAADIVKYETNGKTISRAEVDRNTGDLTLTMGSTYLTFLCLSSGYEAWRITHGDLEYVCTGAGKVVDIGKRKTSEQGVPPGR